MGNNEMREIKELFVITEGFPNPDNPYRYTFVEQLMQEFSKKNVKVTVVNPVYHNYPEYQYREKWVLEVNDGLPITVYQPRIFNFSMKKIGPLKLMNASYHSFYHAVKKTIVKNHLNPDAVYSHFIFPSGCVAAELGKVTNIPSFCATGESDLTDIIQRFGKQFLRERLNSLHGIVSVSSENKKILIDNNMVDLCPIIVMLNGVDQKIFFPHDKVEMRKKLGFPQDQIIGIFVGAFSERKGVQRVEYASDKISIPMIYIGTGDLQPRGENVLFSGGVQHHMIPEYLSAADFFVLPTKNEGCCNAIIEAICCGLPIISSKGDFNDDILNETYSIRIDPDNIDQIAHAMNELSENHILRKQMSEYAAKQRKRYSLSNRAEAILRFMSEESKW